MPTTATQNTSDPSESGVPSTDSLRDPLSDPLGSGQEAIDPLSTGSSGTPSDRSSSGDPDDERDLAAKTQDLHSAVAEVTRLQQDGDLLEGVEQELPEIRDRYRLTWLNLKPLGDGVYAAEGKVNPYFSNAGQPMLTDDDVAALAEEVEWAMAGDAQACVDVLTALTARFPGDFSNHLMVSWAESAVYDRWKYLTDRQNGLADVGYNPPGPPGGLPWHVVSRLQDAFDAVGDAYMPIRVGAGDGGSHSAMGSSSSKSASSKSSSSKGSGSSKQGPAREVAVGDSGGGDHLAALQELQACTRGSKHAWSDKALVDIGDRLGELAALRRLYVEDSEEGPEEAVTTADPGTVSIVRLDQLPVPGSRARPWPDTITYVDGDYLYHVTLYEPTKPGQVPVLCDAPFDVVRTPPRRTKTAKGRSYTGAQGFYPNPDYAGKRDEASAPTEVPGAHGVVRFAGEKQAIAAGLVPQESGEHEPWVFCVPAGFADGAKRPDAKVNGNAGIGRRAPIGSFAEESEGQQMKRASVYQTHRPSTSRSDAKRAPQSEANGVPAHRFMGSGGARDDLSVPAFAGDRNTMGSHEYCHLVGDGDNGACDEANLVVGTAGANTEQLAMEETLRPYRSALRRLGFSVRLMVSAIVGNTPVEYDYDDEPADFMWPQWSMASFIEYRIEAVPEDTGLPMRDPLPVHTQVIDGQRGVITAMEVEVVKNTLTKKFDELLGELQGIDKELTGETMHGLDFQEYDSRSQQDFAANRLVEPESSADHELDDSKSSPVKAMDLAEDPGDRAVGRGAVLNGRGLGRLADVVPQPPNTRIGRFAQGDYVGGGAACAGTALRAAERLLNAGFAGLDVEDTVRQGVSDYTEVRAAHPAAPPFLANYEMRNAPEVDYDLDFVQGFTVQNGDFDPLWDALDVDGIAVALTAGGYNFTAAQVNGVYGVFDSHANRIHQRAYAETFPNIGALMSGILDIIAQHNVNPHDDVAVEVYMAQDDDE